MSIEQPNSSAEQETIKLIQSSTRILAIIGAGLSRPSGLPTFRQDPWFWQSPVNEVATPVAFAKDPLRVWSVYERLRQLALTATPNRGHAALAALSQSRTESLFVTQNIGELSRRAGHDSERLIALHGSLFDVKCSNPACNYTDRNISPNPTVPGLVVHLNNPSHTSLSHPQLDKNSIPQCPSCKSGLLRPGVIWFGETLPPDASSRVESWLGPEEAKVDLVLVIGTERTPFVFEATERGAQVAYFTLVDGEIEPEDFEDADWVIGGDDLRHYLTFQVLRWE